MIRLFVNATVLTLDASLPVAQALAVKNGRIVEVGGTDEVLWLREDEYEVIDLQGRTVVPGFVDPHNHFSIGAFETPPFHTGTVAIARVAAELTHTRSILTIAGGGDTIAALNKADVFNDFTYVSTAGGAFLEWLEGRELPGVAALSKREGR